MTFTLSTTLPGSILQLPLLPPCRVCGEKGSGFHYGVNTCTPCKGFFQRNSTRKSWPVCQVPSQCAAAKNKKMMCATCRHQKCISLGMSKRASRTGRYTYKQKTENTVEVQQLEVQAKLCRAEQTLLTDEERERELDKMIEQITKEHLKQNPPNEFFECITERELNFKEEQLLKETMYGRMKPLPYEESEQIFQDTGLDIDGRRKLIQDFIPSYDKCVQNYMAFVETLPGFTVLPLKDKVSLIKGSISQCDILSTFHQFNKDIRVWSDPFNWSRMITDSEMSMFYSEEVIDDYVECLSKLQTLDLTPEEQALFQSYAVVTCDVEMSPEGYHTLTAMQEVIFDAFYRVITRNHDNPDRFLSRVISALLHLLSVSKEWTDAEKEFLTRYEDIAFPQTLRYIYDV